MNTPDRSRPNPRASGQFLQKAALAAALCAITVSSTGCFRIGRDAAALRNSLLQSSDTSWTKTIEVGVGTLTLSATRFGLSFVDLEPEARTALQSVRGAEVGVYQLHGGGMKDRGGMLSSADKAMAARGWNRLVGVVKDRDLVAIYVPKKLASTRDIRVCVAVFNDRQFVVASARSDLEPLMAIALNRPEWKERHALALSL